MPDKTITIGITTEADTAAAEALGKSILKIEDAAKTAARDLDVVSAKALQAGRDQKAEAEAQAAAAKAAEEEAKSLKNIEAAGKALVAMKVVDFLKETTAALKEASREGGLLHDQLGDLGPACDAVDGGLSVITAGMGAFVTTGNPVTAVLAGIGAGAGKVASAYMDMANAGKDTAAATARLAEQLEYTRVKTKELNEEKLRGWLREYYKEETDELTRQAAQIERIIQLRAKLASVEQERANRQITIAQQRGGDVDLARANALATELRLAMEALNGELANARNQAGQAIQAAAAAESNYKTAVNQAVSSEELARLSTILDATRTDAATAAEVLAASETEIAARRQNALESVETKFTDQEQAADENISTAAKKSYDTIYQSLKDNVSDEAPRAVAAINTTLSNERAATVASIQTLTPTPQDSAAITGSVKELSAAINKQGNAIIAALAAAAAGAAATTAVINQQGDAINQIYARLR